MRTILSAQAAWCIVLLVSAFWPRCELFARPSRYILPMGSWNSAAKPCPNGGPARFLVQLHRQRHQSHVWSEMRRTHPHASPLCLLNVINSNCALANVRCPVLHNRIPDRKCQALRLCLYLIDAWATRHELALAADGQPPSRNRCRRHSSRRNSRYCPPPSRLPLLSAAPSL